MRSSVFIHHSQWAQVLVRVPVQASWCQISLWWQANTNEQQPKGVYHQTYWQFGQLVRQLLSLWSASHSPVQVIECTESLTTTGLSSAPSFCVGLLCSWATVLILALESIDMMASLCCLWRILVIHASGATWLNLRCLLCERGCVCAHACVNI